MATVDNSLKLSKVDFEKMDIFKYEHWKGVNYDFKVIKQGGDFILDDVILSINKHDPNFIHNFTFSYFGKLDYFYHGLTPDYIEAGTICEFTTTMNDDYESMESKLKMKYDKYSHLLGVDNKLLIIVVSLTRIVSNYDLNIELQIELIKHFNAIKLIQSMIAQDGRLLWHDKDGDVVDKIMTSLLNVKFNFPEKNPLEKSFQMIDDIWPKYNFEDGVVRVLDEINDHIDSEVINESYKEIHFDFEPNEGGRTDLKRITQMPMVIPKLRSGKKENFQVCKFDSADEINKIINESIHQCNSQIQSFDKTSFDDYNELRKAVQEEHYTRKENEKFIVDLDQENLINLALSGVQAKKQRNQTEVKAKREKSKEFFSYDVDTTDISDFINQGKKLLKFKPSKMKVLTEPAFALIKDSSLIAGSRVDGSTRSDDLEALDDFIKFSSSDVGRMLSFFNDLVFELNTNLRTNVADNEFIVKPLRRFDATVYIKTTKSNSHMFFFVKFNDPQIISETIGPKLIKQGNIVCSEWGSVLKRDLENFLNIREKMFSVFVTLKLLHELEDYRPNKTVCDQFMLSLLLILNNKDRNEEIITNLRYVYMKSISITELTSNMLKKYETKFRDRLSVYLTKLVVMLCNKLDANKPSFESNKGIITIKGLVDLFNNPLSFKQTINFTYLGYVMTKVKQMQGNQSFMMIEKILNYELKSNGLNPEDISVNSLFEEAIHKFDYLWVRTFSEIAKTQIIDRFGHNFESLLHSKIINRFKSVNFETIATLKASAKMDILDEKSDFSLKKLKERRPRVIESLFNFVEGNPVHPLNLVEKCIKQLSELDKFNVELFPKDQHNGLREIYVVDFRVRIVQWFIETISRSICDLFPSETLNNINSADGLTNKIIKNSYKIIKSPYPLIKSGDASKWSQSQIVTKFYIVLKSFLPNSYSHLIQNILKLWLNKKIFLPYQLLSIIDSPNFQTNNDLLSQMSKGIKDVYNKSEIFLRIKTGFMQGILHHTSSLFHTIVQEGFKQIKLMFIKNTFKGTNFEKESDSTALWNLQGSDDSMEMIITDSKLYKSNTKFFLTLMHLKDHFSYKFGIIPSKEKTATCVPYIMEYNSNWSISGINVQPMIKFSMVACNIPTLQSLVQRQEYFYNLLKDCLEKGCTTYTCSKIKVAQAMVNYSLLGNVNVPLFDLYSELLIENKNPSLGYFIIEPNVYTGVFGFDFSCYYHFMNSDVSIFGDEELTPFELISTNKSTFRANLTISKMQWTNWSKIIEVCGELTAEETDFLEKNSYYYYVNHHGWDIESLKLKQKLQDFDVKQSLSSKYGASENAAAFYILFVDICKSKGERHSLIEWLNLYSNKLKDKTDFLHKIFPRWKNYDDIISILNIFKNESYVIDTDYVKRGKSKVVVLTNPINLESDYLDVIKHRWFNTEISFSKQSYFDKKFKELQVSFPWLKESESETKNCLNCSSRQLSNYLRSMLGKVRQLTFFDTSARDYGWKYTITRIFKEGQKIVRYGHEPITMQSNNDVFYNLKALCVMPYTLHHQLKTLKTLINDHLNFDDLPPSKRYDYTILQKILNDGDKNEIVNLIMDKSQTQMISFFKTAQYFNKESEKWEGHGVIYFLHEDLHGKIILDDNIVTKIIVNNLHALNENHGELRKLIKSLKAEFNTNQTIALRFTLNSIHRQKNGALVEYDSNLKHDPSSLKNFNVAFERGNFKIVASVYSDQKNSEAIGMNHLYKVEHKRRPKTFEERKHVDSNGFVNIVEWIQNYQYNPNRHGDIIDEKYIANGRDAKFTTIINFEMWKLVSNPYAKQLFDWGFLSTKMLKDEEIKTSDLLDDIIRSVPNSTPINKIRHYYLKKNNYSDELKTIAYRAMSLDPSMGTLISEHKKKEEVKVDLVAEIVAMIHGKKFEKFRLTESKFGFNEVDFESLRETEDDFSYHKDLIYPDIRATYSMPTNIFYYLRSETKKYLDKSTPIEDLFLHSRDMINIPLRLQILLNVLFETDLMTKANTMKHLKLEMFKSESELSMEIQSFKSKSSVSSKVIRTKILDNSLESEFLRKFKIDIKDENHEELIKNELSNLDEIIYKMEELIDKENVSRLKYSLINQKVKFHDDKVELSKLYDKLLLENKPAESKLHLIDETKDENEEESDDYESEPIESDEGTCIYSDTSTDVEELYEEDDYHKVGRDCFELEKFDWLLYVKPLNYFNIKRIIEMMSSIKFKDHFNELSKIIEMEIIFKCEDGTHEHYGSDELLTLNIFDESHGYSVYSLIVEDKSDVNIIYRDIIMNTHVVPISSSPNMSCLFNAISKIMTFYNINIDQSMLRLLCANYQHDVSDDEIIEHRSKLLDTNEMGNEMDIFAISNVFSIQIRVVTDYKILTYNEQGRPNPYYLLNKDNIHFDILEEIN